MSDNVLCFGDLSFEFQDWTSCLLLGFMKVLFLDDDKSRVDEFEANTGLKVCHVDDGRDFIAALFQGPYDVIFLDHDLATDDYTGSDAAGFLSQNLDLLNHQQTVIVHSANPVGTANMLAKMRDVGHVIQAFAIPFAWNKVKLVDQRLVFTV